jgi:hypothetical protein
LGAILVSVLTTTIFYRYRVKAFIHFKLHPFDIDECEGERMTYDIFLSHASEDREFAYKTVERLEREESHLPKGGYKVCFHERDSDLGSFLTENIQQAIDGSKRVVCLLTRHFIESEWCMTEFRAAWSQSQKLRKRRLIAIKWPEVDGLLESGAKAMNQLLLAQSDIRFDNLVGSGAETTNQSPLEKSDIRLFLSVHRHIKYSPDSDDWWHELIYALPRRSLLQSDETTSLLESWRKQF